MLKVGLTGGIGCGKSTAVRYFMQLDIPVIDADKIAKTLLEPKQPTLHAIATLFGADFLHQDGSLHREKLKKEVFSCSESLQKLEAIMHPQVRKVIIQQLSILNKQSDVPYAVVDIPLLVEKGYCSLFDHIVVIDCLPQQQIERVSQRDKMDQPIIQSIMKVQASRTERLNKATNVLNNIGDVDQLYAQIVALHAQLTRTNDV
ncbi:MAG TPA: dephospho-CoA kinase [Thiothrix sp.]|nr:dephospho-CoA kinase [Thiothrix sp.]